MPPSRKPVCPSLAFLRLRNPVVRSPSRWRAIRISPETTHHRFRPQSRPNAPLAPAIGTHGPPPPPSSPVHLHPSGQNELPPLPSPTPPHRSARLPCPNFRQHGPRGFPLRSLKAGSRREDQQPVPMQRRAAPRNQIGRRESLGGISGATRRRNGNLASHPRRRGAGTHRARSPGESGARRVVPGLW